MIKLGRRPGSSGGINEPRRLDGPEPGANELLRSPNGLFSRITSICGASRLISGTLTAGISYYCNFMEQIFSLKKSDFNLIIFFLLDFFWQMSIDENHKHTNHFLSFVFFSFNQLNWFLFFDFRRSLNVAIQLKYWI